MDEIAWTYDDLPIFYHVVSHVSELRIHFESFLYFICETLEINSVNLKRLKSERTLFLTDGDC